MRSPVAHRPVSRLVATSTHTRHITSLGRACRRGHGNDASGLAWRCGTARVGGLEPCPRPRAWLMDLADCSALISVPPLLRRVPVKQGPFAPAGLCCPDHHHYYDPLRLPFGRRPLRGVTAYRPTRFRIPAGPGPRRASPVSQDNRLTVPRPLRREVPPHPFQDQGAFHGLRPLRAGSAPPWPALAGTVSTPQASLHAADRPVAPPRFAPRLSATHGGFPTEDPGVSPNRTRTGWLP